MSHYQIKPGLDSTAQVRYSPQCFAGIARHGPPCSDMYGVARFPMTTAETTTLNPYGVRFLGRDEFSDLARAGGDLPTDIGLHQSFIVDDIKADDTPASRQITFAVSTEGIDRDRDVIRASGWKLASYKKNPVVLFAHNYYEPPIARAAKIGVDSKQLISTADFVPKEISPFADMIYQMVKGGYLRAASVGFRPMKTSYDEERRGFDVLEAELLEWSVVPVPANAEALVQWSAAMKGTPQLKAYVEWCEKYLDEHYGGKGVWVPRTQVEKVFEAMNRGLSVAVPPTDPTPTTPVESDSEPILRILEDEAEPVLILAEDELPTYRLDLDVIAETITTAYTRRLTELVGAAVRTEVNYARGRVE